MKTYLTHKTFFPDDYCMRLRDKPFLNVVILLESRNFSAVFRISVSSNIFTKRCLFSKTS